jgi:hypothetical protein
MLMMVAWYLMCFFVGGPMGVVFGLCAHVAMTVGFRKTVGFVATILGTVLGALATGCAAVVVFFFLVKFMVHALLG